MRERAGAPGGVGMDPDTGSSLKKDMFAYINNAIKEMSNSLHRRKNSQPCKREGPCKYCACNHGEGGSCKSVNNK